MLLLKSNKHIKRRERHNHRKELFEELFGKTGKKEEKPPLEESGIFGKLFEKIKIKKGKIKEHEASKSDADELEEEIKNLSLFEKTEPKTIEVDKKITGRGKNLEKCYEIMDYAEESINKGNITKAKELYIKARNIYIDLEYVEKKEIHDELRELYNKLLK